MNIKRSSSLILRHFYLIRSSFPRIFDLIYWPTVQILLWGFISKFLQCIAIILIMLLELY